MGIFEQHPWILIPIIIVTMEAWSALKRLASRKGDQPARAQRLGTGK